jgi:hypothetical protein
MAVKSNLLSVSVTPCHLINISVCLQLKIRWDAVKQEIVGDSEANA